MPLDLWLLPGFTATWLTGLAFHAWCVCTYRTVPYRNVTTQPYPRPRFGTFIYYIVLVAQQVLGLSALQTGVRMIPFSVFGMYLDRSTLHAMM